MTTAFIGVEALSNPHPLTYQSAHPKDTSPLMPNHLLHGQIGESAPEIDEMYFIGIWLDKTPFRSLISQRGETVEKTLIPNKDCAEGVRELLKKNQQRHLHNNFCCCCVTCAT